MGTRPCRSSGSVQPIILDREQLSSTRRGTTICGETCQALSLNIRSVDELSFGGTLTLITPIQFQFGIFMPFRMTCGIADAKIIPICHGIQALDLNSPIQIMPDASVVVAKLIGPIA